MNNASNLIVITVEHTKDLSTWLPILNKLSTNKHIMYRTYEHLDIEDSQIVRLNEYCVRVICPIEFIESLMPILRIREITDEITFDLDQPNLTSQLHREIGANMEPYIISQNICNNCKGTGKDPQYINDECIGCAGIGEIREYDFIKYLDDIKFKDFKLKPS